jgi:NADPH:quinone reductase-like Zn-dependent oxidoreductase/acyl carrier protein
VLIHSATGGVGLAALQLAKRAGAEIFATAGSLEKREYLLARGIQQVMDSRSLSFADEILENTRGEGVDLVLNSLAGNAITKGLQILKPYGRFLEIGKRDIYQNSKMGLLPFQKNLSYFAIDLDKMSRERPEVVGGMLRELFGMIERHELTPLPLQTFPVSQVSEAFRMMAQAKHIGKIVVTLEDSNASFEIPAGAIPIHGDGTYLITGGLGALGLTFAQWLAKQGARRLILLGRSKPSETAQKVISELQDANVHVTAAQVDITDINQLIELFTQIKQTVPPLKGVVHAAGLLADGTIPQMDQERFMQAYAPKALGAWNLHALTADQPLDFFIMFSSVAAILGTPGQLNYAAGNTYLDALARFRHAQNLPALSVNWGPWSEIGLAAEQKNRGERLNQQGLKSITPSQGIEAISSLMTHRDPQVSVMRLDANKWCMAQPVAARSSLFKDLLSQTAHKANEQLQLTKSIHDELMAVESGKQRRTLFEAHVREQIAYVLHLAPSRVTLDKPLKTLGLDSLMSIELRNRLEDSLHVALSASLIWNYPTVRHLTDFLAEKIGVSFEKDGVTVEEPLKANSKDSSEAETESLSKAELDAMLREELEAIEDLLGDNENEQHA